MAKLTEFDKQCLEKIPPQEMRSITKEAEERVINATIKDAAIAFFALAQFLMDSGLTEVQVKLNLDAAIRQYKRNKRLEAAKN